MSESEITIKDIEHLKDLARVEFGEKETEKLARDLGEILGYVDELKNADVANVPEMTHALEGVKNIFRKDEEVVTHPLTPSLKVREGEKGGGLSSPDEYVLAKELIDAFPEKHDAGHGTYLKVKSIL